MSGRAGQGTKRVSRLDREESIDVTLATWMSRAVIWRERGRCGGGKKKPNKDSREKMYQNEYNQRALSDMLIKLCTYAIGN
jgi:hypothetical protein